MMKRIIIIGCLILGTFQMVRCQDYYKVRRARFSTATDDERSPTLYGDGLILMSNASMTNVKQDLDNNGNKFFNLFFIEKNDRTYGEPDLFARELGSKVGYPSFTGDEMTMVYAKFYAAPGNEIPLPIGIFFAEKQGEEWVSERPFEYNDPGYSLLTPWIARDGKTLYFSADFEDGFGGYDLYVSHLEGGRWSEPENMGEAINSSGNEKDPFFHPINRLFFSSDGFDRGGGYDIFQSDFFNGVWTTAEKLPFRKINSGSDDYAIRFSDDFESGYFERRGGTIDIYEITTDIPVFEEPVQTRSNYHRRFLLKENSLNRDSLDPELYSVAWVIDDTIVIPELEVIYAFPGPGTYNIRFEVYDKLLDSTKVIINRDQRIDYREQAAITCPDTVTVNREVELNARETRLPYEIDQYYWEFGDGYKAEGIRTRHTYKLPGKYKIILGVKERVPNRRMEPRVRSGFKEIVVLPSG